MKRAAVPEECAAVSRSRGDEAVSLEQFCEVLESVSRLAAGSRGESEEVRAGRKRRPQGSWDGLGREGR